MAFENDPLTPEKVQGLIEKQAVNSQASLRQNLLAASDTNPDQYAEATRLGRNADVPAAFVAADLPRYKKDAALPAEETRAIVTRYPNVAAWMQNPDNARLMHDDLPTLRYALDTARGVTAAGAQIAADVIGQTGKGFKDLSQFGADRAVELGGWRETVAPYVWGGVNFVGSALEMSGDGWGFIADKIRPERQNAVTMIAEGLGQFAAQAYLVSRGQVGAAAAIGVAQGAAQQRETLEAAEKAEGKEFTAGEKLARVGAGSLVTGATELVPVTQVLGKLKIFEKVMDALPPAMKNKYVNKLVRIGAAGTTEALQETAENMLHDAISVASGDKNVEFFKDWQTVAGVSGGVGSIAQALVMAVTGVRAGRMAGRERQASDATKQAAMAAKEAVQATKLHGRDPQKMAELLKEGVPADSTMRFDGNVIDQFYQSEDDIEAFFENAPSAREQFELARETGSDVEIPLSEFLTALTAAPSNNYDYMLDFAKVDPDVDPGLQGYDTSNPEELNAFIEQAIRQAQEEHGARFERVQEAALGERIERQIRDNLMNRELMGEKVRTPEAAATEAALYGSYARTLMERGGDAARRIFERRFGVNFQIEGFKPMTPPRTGSTGEADYDRLRKKVQAKQSRQNAKKKAPAQAGMFGVFKRKREAATPKPLMNYLISLGGVQRGSKLAGELAARDVTPKQYPRLFTAQGGITDGDTLVVSELNDAVGQDHFRDVEGNMADDGQYAGAGLVDTDQLVDALADESNGNWIRSQEELRQEEYDEADQAVLDALQEEGIDIVADKPTAKEIDAALKRVADRRRAEYEEAGGELFYQSEQKINTESEEFKKWFGDSKVVDADGKPLVVYHGTTASIEAFDPAKIGSNFGYDTKGFFFTDSERSARSYSMTEEESGDRAFRMSAEGRAKADARTVKAYVSIQTPLTLNDVAADPRYEKKSYMDPIDFYDDNRGIISDLLDSGKYDGVIFKLGGERLIAPLRPEQIKSIFNRGTFDPNDARILYQGEDTKFGSYSRLDNGKRVVRLFEKANQSTLLHETGHVFLDLFAEIAQQDDAPQAVKDDFAKVLEWMGVASAADIKTKQHEQFARGFEAYLYKGEAPSQSLRGVFDSFRVWLVNVYRSIKQLNVNVTPEVTAVFDRMLATNDEIDAMRSNPTFSADEATLEMLTDSQREDYLKRKEEALRDAKNKLFRKAYRQKKRQATEWWTQESAAMQTQVEKELQARPVYQVIQFLHTGQDFDGNPIVSGLEGDGTKGVKLDEAAVIKIFDGAGVNPLGKFEVKYLPRGTRTTQDGADPRIVADMFGFADPLSMLKEMQKAAEMPYKRAVAQMTEDRMIAKYGDMLNDGTLEREAIAMVMAEDTKAAQVELEALAARNGAEYPSDGDFKKAAEIALGQLSVDAAIKSERFYRAALKATREYGSALRAKDYEKAADAKRREILNKHLHKLSRDARTEQEKALARFKDLEKMPPKGDAKKVKIDPEYHQKIWDILAKYNLNPRVSMAKETRLQMAAINQWIMAKENDENAQLLMPPELLAADGKTHYRDLTMNEFRGLRDLVVNLETQGRLKRKYIMQGQARELAELVGTLVETAEAHNEVNIAPLNSKAADRRAGRKALNIVNGIDAVNTKTQQMMVQLDGGDNLGLWTKTIYEPVQRAEIEKNRRARDEYLKFNAILEQYYGDKRDGYMNEIVVAGSNRDNSLSREDMLSIALHYTGTENTRTKLIAGYKKTRGWDADYIESILTNMTAADWNFVMDVRTYLDSFWSEASAIEARRYGYAPEKQEALPDMEFETADGQTVKVKGGYMRIKYDGQQDASAAMNQVDETFKDMSIGRSNRAALKRGSMIEQVDGVQRPIRLDFGVLTEHIAEQVGYITMSETVDNVNKVLRNPDIQQTLQDTLGEDKRQMLELWLKDVAVGNAVSAGKMSWLKTVRQNYTVGRLGLRPLTAMLQLSGLAHVAADPEIGFKGLARGLVRLNSTGNPLEISNYIKEKSVFMQERSFTLNRDVTDALAEYTEKAQYTKQKISALLLYPMQKVQEVTDNITWLAAYDTATKKGLEETDAVRAADLAVARLQASGLSSDLAAIERGTLGATVQRQELVKATTMFFSYFNAKYNIIKNANTKFNNKEINGAELASSYLMAILVEGLISAAIMGQLDWDDDKDGELSGMEMAMGMLGVGLSQGAATIPFVRTVAGGFQGFSGETAAMGQLAGLGEFAARLVSTGKKIATGDTDKINGYAITRQAVDALNVFIPLPAGVINQFVRGVEKEQKEGDAEILDYLVFRK